MTQSQIELPTGILPGVEYVDLSKPDIPDHMLDSIATLRRLQREAADEIERLISLLDAIDGDIECEDDETKDDDGIDEPSLAAVEEHPGWYYGGKRPKCGDQTNWAAGNSDDCEGDEHDGREPDDEDDSHDGCEPDEDNEPTLGSQDRLFSQQHMYQAGSWHAGDDGEKSYVDVAAHDRARLRYRDQRQRERESQRFGYIVLSK